MGAVVGDGTAFESLRRDSQVRSGVALRADGDGAVVGDVQVAVLEELVAADEAGWHDVGHHQPLLAAGRAAPLDVGGADKPGGQDTAAQGTGRLSGATEQVLAELDLLPTDEYLGDGAVGALVVHGRVARKDRNKREHVGELGDGCDTRLEDRGPLLVGGQAQSFHGIGTEGGARHVLFFLEDVDADALGVVVARPDRGAVGEVGPADLGDDDTLQGRIRPSAGSNPAVGPRCPRTRKSPSVRDWTA